MVSISSENTAPSSTPLCDNAVFSDESMRASSPPSSPPAFPWEQQKTDTVKATPPPKPFKNAFSVLGKRKAPETISANAPLKKKSIANPPRSGAKPAPTQLQMSLGQEVQKKCKTCGMEYVSSSSEDRNLHAQYHKQNTEGYDVGKDFVQNTKKEGKYKVFKGLKNGDAIVVLDCLDKQHRRRRGQAVLDIVQRELGAVPIDEEDVWGAKAMQEAVGSNSNARFKAYLYVRGTKCVGSVLTEQIGEALQILQPEGVDSRPAETRDESGNSSKNALAALKARKQSAEVAKEAQRQAIKDAAQHPIQLSTTPTSAILGISRIWTSPTHRGQGIAISLLDTAVKHHNLWQADGDASQTRVLETTRPEVHGFKNGLAKMFGGMKKIDSKDQVAFSQPTDSGAKLARRWFGRAWGWKVYVD